MPESDSTRGDFDCNNAARSSSEPDLATHECNRRTLLTSGSSLAMFGGLAAGYGTFVAMAGRYFFPVGDNKAWFFVSDAEGIQPGQSVAFKSPAGVQVSITRRTDAAERTASAESFLALSSICPHLGCRVQWEPHNDRFFCPCHNGVFDKAGTAVTGPPAAAKQNLPRYPLMVVDGKLYIQMPAKSV